MALFASLSPMRHSLISVVFAVAVAGSSAQAEFSNVKQYGNCTAATEIDIFTDEVSHTFFCVGNDTKTKETFLILSNDKGKKIYVRVVNRPIPEDSAATVPIAIRIDKGPIIKRIGEWVGDDFAIIPDSELAYSLLKALASAQRVALKVGDASGLIVLRDSRRGVADFRQRIGLSAR